MNDRLRSRRRSKGRKEARRISRLIYVLRKTGRSRERVELSLEFFFLNLPLDQPLHPTRLGVRLREREEDKDLQKERLRHQEKE